MIDLDAIEARCNAATPGPWRAGNIAAEAKVWCDYPEGIEGPVMGERCLLIMNKHFPHDADREFIAASRTDVPALLANLRETRAALAGLVEALPRCTLCVAFATGADDEERKPYCDGHGGAGMPRLPHAAALRTALRVLGEGGGRG
jgi:hypothetical protein